jgi:hypothetical protein
MAEMKRAESFAIVVVFEVYGRILDKKLRMCEVERR